MKDVFLPPFGPSSTLLYCIASSVELQLHSAFGAPATTDGDEAGRRRRLHLN